MTCCDTVSRHIHMSRLADENARANDGACTRRTGKNVRYGVPLHMYASLVIRGRETLKILQWAIRQSAGDSHRLTSSTT